MGWIFDGVYIHENDLIEGDEIVEIDGSEDEDSDEDEG
jgi:hypothetical protein